MKKLITLLLFLCSSAFLFSQSTVSGKIVDDTTGDPMVGATVIVEGSTTGTITDVDGGFSLEANEGDDIIISYIGFLEKTITVIRTGDLGMIGLEEGGIGLEEVMVVADVAIDRKTPVAVSNIPTEVFEAKLGNQEFVDVLRNTPSIYATKGSGGFGDSRINVRGFAQEDVALLINGIPVNGMEDNKIYWSNWAGLGDVTRTTQIQRGLGASKLAVASVGGTINIITKTTDQEAGGNVFTSIGNDNYRKTGMTLSTGRSEKGWAFTVAGSRTTGDGYIEGAYIDAYSYFFSAAKEIGDKHLVMLTGFGAPQRHGQRSFEHGISDQLNKYGKRWNDDFGSYNGQDFHIRENFYHKPQIGLSHIFNMNDKTDIVTSAYVSVGRGGGTGDIGGLVRGDGAYREREFRQARDAYGHFQFDEVAKYNQGLENTLYDTSMVALNYETADGETGSAQIAVNKQNGLIKRASMNEHQWVGLLSNVTTELTSDITLTGGVDLRWYTGSHYRKTIDLLGADFWFDDDNVNNQVDWVDLNADGVKDDNEFGRLIRPTNDADRLFGSVDVNDRIDYYNDENINWYGTYGQLEYSNSGLSAFVSGAVNYTQMRRIDFFNKPEDSNTTDWLSFIGGNVKLGANYNINASNNVFVNAGYISRAPYFDALFPTFNNDAPNTDATNEGVIAVEAGYGYRDRRFTANLNGYYTSWSNKTEVSNFQDAEGVAYFLNLQGVDALHTGVELDLAFGLFDGFEVTGFASVGNWEWKNDPTGTVSDASNEVIGETQLFLKDIKVGDAAQTTLGAGFEWELLDGLSIDGQYFYADNLYAAFQPDDRDDEGLIGVQPLKLDPYGLTDAGLSWKFPFGGMEARFRANVNNLFNVEYISDLIDRPGDEINNTRGWFGFGRTWNAGLKLYF